MWKEREQGAKGESWIGMPLWLLVLCFVGTYLLTAQVLRAPVRCLSRLPHF